MSPRIRRAESQQQTRQRLLEAAFRVFSSRGYHASSLDAIADEAGYSKGAVYSNFANKDELFLELLDYYSAEQMKGWEKIRLLFSAATSQEVEESQDAYANYVQQHRSWILLQLEFILHALRDEKMRVEVARRLRAMREVMKEHITAAHAIANSTPKSPIENLPLYLFSFDIGLSIQALLDPESIPSDPYIPAVRQLLG